MSVHTSRQTATNAPAPLDPMRVLRFMVALAVAQVVCIIVGTACSWPRWASTGFTFAVSASWVGVSRWILRGARRG